VSTREALIARLGATGKYGALTPPVLGWAVGWAMQRAQGEKAILKLARRKLHQAFGAFLDAPSRKRALRLLTAARDAQDDEEWRAALRAVVAEHASTAERADPAALWTVLQRSIGPVRSVLDLGCGLAPAQLPFTGLDPQTAYTGVDLDVVLCAALQEALQPRWPAVRVVPGEVRSGGPWPASDVALLGKLVTTLERQQAGAAAALLDRLDATWVVATFPTRTLSGRDRGMHQTNAALAERLLPGGTTATVGDELVRWARRSV